mmetsp:Transcript_37043/g.37699  ORF Transcript_37043/g.37699 Transcript_37043/m.37699 type:complete len:230 (+) Transcript_37043:117-806(+)|eukprot:CAMPEP_0182427734 /NCGR_PEP_ID=MMETSP1167-20130531/19038_1 /TAXON_ID=2988 /ORGANISM="Mallomonas Sp, Strain CCMP3275" /LENGTH=229 /DNA_ID=CAMNT_0024610175 /DNA_START=75 /DNA_END=764 /DNA_ORIENTATION=+
MGNYIRCGKDESTGNFGCTCGTDEKDRPEDYSDVHASGKISNKVCFGAGCYWGTEKFFKHDFGGKRFPESNIKGMVGFMGPPNAPENPTYKDVCTGVTGHVEVYYIEFDGGSDMFENLVRFFFQFHDPTVPNRQGNDKGTQYASVIYCYDKAQMAICHKVKKELQEIVDRSLLPNVYASKTIVTAIEKSTKFYPAHAAHQDYLQKNPKGYCNHKIRFADWPVIVKPETS